MEFKQLSTKTLFNDIRFWILLFLIVRLVGITNPPIETGHGWRQSFTCMVARNLLEKDPDIFYPRTDLCGSNSDIIASEFPLFNYLIYLVAKVFGYQHWYGRLINLLFSSAGIYAFYLLAKKYFGERVAFFSGIIFLTSAWFSFSRKIMPDTFSVALVLMGLYFLSRFIDKNKTVDILLFILLSALGGLSKIPSTIILSLAIIPVLKTSLGKKKRVIILTALLSAIFVIGFWYFYWEPYLLQTYKNQLYFPRSLWQGLNELIANSYWTFDKFIFVALHSFVALGFFIFGCYQAIKQRNQMILLVFCITLPVQFFFMLKAGFVFSTHDYYILSYVPIMALIAGFGLASVKWVNIAWVFALFIMLEGIANQQHDFRIKKSNLYLLDLEKVSDKISSRNDKIAITGGLNPQGLYFAHRKGWGITNEDLCNQAFILNLKKEGCKYLFVNRHDSDLILMYQLVFKNYNFCIYRL
jgi:hypothetical protein